MSKNQTVDMLVVAGIVLLVAGVAWFKSAQKDAPAATNDGPAVVAVQPGELCPEPPPTAERDDRATSGPATPAGGSALVKKLPRVVDLGATKCKACIELAPILEELKKEYAGRVTVDFIDVWKDPKAGDPYKIRVIPTQVFFDADGKEVWRHEGFMPKTDFVAKFKELGVK